MTQEISYPTALLIPAANVEEAQFLLDMQREYRARPKVSVTANLSDLEQRMLAALRTPFLKPAYTQLLHALHREASDRVVPNTVVAGKMGLNVNQVGSMMAKLSQRMKMALAVEEASKFKTPIYVMVDVTYDQKGASFYKLTPSGRAVVGALLPK